MTRKHPAELSNSDRAFNETATFIERLPYRKPFRATAGQAKILTLLFYNLISHLDRDRKLTFMNYGYIDSDPARPPLNLGREDEHHRYQIQMYHHIASVVDWTGLHALEVGSGRGGGASYITRHFKPKSMTGVDLSGRAVAFCNRYHSSVKGLRFVQGDAEALQFPDESFDIILNLESSLYYPNVERFFSHVARILKPNGYFLYADMRFLEEVENWHKQLTATGLEMLLEEDITKNAKRALALDQEYRRVLIQKYVPRLLQKSFSRFGGSDGGRLADDSPSPGKRIYKRFVFRKRAI